MEFIFDRHFLSVATTITCKISTTKQALVNFLSMRQIIYDSMKNPEAESC